MRDRLARATIVRHGAVAVSTSGRWAGAWHWPVTVAVLPTVSGREVAAEIARSEPVQRGHARIVEYVPGVQPDILILEQLPEPSAARGLPQRVGVLLVLDSAQEISDERLESVRRAAHAGAAVSLRTPQLAFVEVFTGLLTELSHDRTFDDALLEAFRLRAQQPRAIVKAVVAPDFLVESRLSTRIDRMVSEARSLGGDTSLALSKDATNRLAIVKSLAAGTPAVDFALTVESALDEMSFDAESGSATGAAALDAALEDAKTGPAVRYADVLLYRGRTPDTASRLSSKQVLAFDQEYLAEFAFRGQRIGIGYDTDPKPLQATVSSETQLLVALSAGPGSEVVIDNPVQPMSIKPTGDTRPVRFVFRPRSARNGVLLLEFRVFCRLNLLEYVVLEATVEGYERESYYHDAQRMLQPERFRRYEGDLARALPPVSLGIDVTTDGPEFLLTFASHRPDGISLAARPAFGPEDLRKLLGTIRDRWLDIGLDVFNASIMPRTALSGRQKLQELARAGKDLWNLLFRSGSPAGAIWTVGDSLQADPLPDGARISVRLSRNARGFVFPWQLLYDRGDPSQDAVDPLGFWGARYRIEQQISRDALKPDGDDEAPEVVRMSAFFDATIQQANAQKTLTGELAQASKGSAMAIEALESRAGLEKRLSAGDDRLLYFFCHGTAAAPYAEWAEELRRVIDASRKDNSTARALHDLLQGDAKLNGTDTALKLTKSVVPLADLTPLRAMFRHDPVVFMNMCESALLLPDAARSFVSFFLYRFAAAVIGTECPVPPVFADRMARMLLPALLSGKPVGEALLAIRRQMLEKHGNPLALAYVLWGDTEAAVMPAPLLPEVARQFVEAANAT